MHDKKSRLVYSTDQTVPRREKPAETAQHDYPGPGKQRVTVRLDRKARGGKSVTVIEGLQMPWQESDALLKKLKTRLGTGGTISDTAALEIQGDQRDPIMSFLESLGYKPKRSGG
ncbi:MAG: translation initiation factor [Thermodesulfovibrionales bacterium]